MWTSTIYYGSASTDILEELKEENRMNNTWPGYYSVSLLHYILYNSSKKTSKAHLHIELWLGTLNDSMIKACYMRSNLFIKCYQLSCNLALSDCSSYYCGFGIPERFYVFNSILF